MCWGVRGWQWVCGGSSSALWLSHKKQYCFHKSSHVHACFPLHPDLCDCGMRMCGKEALEDELLFFVRRLTLKLRKWVMRKFCCGELAGVPDGGRGLCLCRFVPGDPDEGHRQSTQRMYELGQQLASSFKDWSLPYGWRECPFFSGPPLSPSYLAGA